MFFLAAILLSSSIGADACVLKGNLEKCEAVMKIAVENGHSGPYYYEYNNNNNNFNNFYDYYNDYNRNGGRNDRRGGCANLNLCKKQCKTTAQIVGVNAITRKCDALCKNFVQRNLDIRASCAKEIRGHFNSNARCSAHRACSRLNGMDGNCCPMGNGKYLDCCSSSNGPVHNPRAQCSRHNECSRRGLTGQCCPTTDGVRLECCGN